MTTPRKKSTPPPSPEETSKSPFPSIEGTLELLSRSIVETYPSDPTFPAINISYLPQLQKFYISLVRYKYQYAAGSYVIFSAKEDSLVAAVNAFKALWLLKLRPTKSATEELLNRFKGGI
jgi:hypothetical protein